jgi:hypothetical protein
MTVAPPDKGVVDPQDLQLLEARDPGDPDSTSHADVPETEAKLHLREGENGVPGRSPEGDIERWRAHLLERGIDGALVHQGLGPPLERRGRRT